MKKILIIVIALVLTAAGIGAAIFLLKAKNVPIPDNPASSVCGRIPEQEIKYICLARVNSSEEFCQKIEEPAKNVCLALVKKDSSYCQKQSPENQQFCYQSLVSAAGKPEYCDELQEPKEISACYVHFVSTNYFASNLDVLSPNQCEKVTPNMPEKDLCVAMTTQNINVCAPERIDCRGAISKDVSWCEQSVSATDKAECYHAVALLTKNVSLCSKIGETEEKDNCLQDYGRLSKDETLCDKINDKGSQSQCLNNVAQNIANQ